MEEKEIKEVPQELVFKKTKSGLIGPGKPGQIGHSKSNEASVVEAAKSSPLKLGILLANTTDEKILVEINKRFSSEEITEAKEAYAKTLEEREDKQEPSVVICGRRGGHQPENGSPKSKKPLYQVRIF